MLPTPTMEKTNAAHTAVFTPTTTSAIASLRPVDKRIMAMNSRMYDVTKAETQERRRTVSLAESGLRRERAEKVEYRRRAGRTTFSSSESSESSGLE